MFPAHGSNHVLSPNQYLPEYSGFHEGFYGPYHVRIMRYLLPIGEPVQFLVRFGSVRFFVLVSRFGPATVHVGSVRGVRLGSL